MDRRIETFLQFVQRYVVFAGGVIGALLLAAGVYFDPKSDTGTVLIGLGGSIFAAFVLALISLSRDDLLDGLFRQGVVEVFPSRVVRCTDEHWRNLLGRVSREYRVLGVANHGYIGPVAKQERYEQMFSDAIARGVEIELLWLSPTTLLAERREIEEGRATRADTVKSIGFFWDLRAKLGGDAQARLLLKEHEHMPSCGLTRADDRLTVTHYVPGQDNLDSPGWILTASAYPFYRRVLAFLRRDDANPELVEVYLNTYREVQAQASDITADRMKELRDLLPTFDVGKPSESDNRQQLFPEADE